MYDSSLSNKTVRLSLILTLFPVAKVTKFVVSNSVNELESISFSSIKCSSKSFPSINDFWRIEMCWMKKLCPRLKSKWRQIKFIFSWQTMWSCWINITIFYRSVLVILNDCLTRSTRNVAFQRFKFKSNLSFDLRLAIQTLTIEFLNENLLRKSGFIEDYDYKGVRNLTFKDSPSC